MAGTDIGVLALLTACFSSHRGIVLAQESRDEPPRAEREALQSWKEIAAYLERDVRTAHRWEKEAGLPVRRHSDKRHASVYAYPSEIEAWRAARPLQAEESSIALWKRPRLWVAVGALAAAAAAIIYGPFLNPKAPTAEAADGAMRAELVPNGVADPASSLSRDGRWLLYPAHASSAKRRMAAN